MNTLYNLLGTSPGADNETLGRKSVKKSNAAQKCRTDFHAGRVGQRPVRN
jgi:hypothetical protein